MNKTKIITGIAAALAVCTLTSCGGKDVMTYGSSSISENEFRYYLATYKGRYAQTYSDFKDSHEFFSRSIDSEGRTAEEVLYEMVQHNVKMTLVTEELFEEYNLTLPAGCEDMINDFIAGLVEDYAGGNKNVLNAALGEYGINMKMLKTICLRDEKTSALYDFLYGEGGEEQIDDVDRTKYLNDNYVRVRHIYVNNKYVYDTDEEGRQKYTEDGLYATRGLTDEEKAAKDALVKAIDDSLAEGGDFEEVYEAFSEDKYYENGYYITRDMDFIDGVIETAFELEVGEYEKIESDYGTHYVMRLEMDERPWENEGSADFFENYDETVSESLFAEKIESYIGEVQCDEEALSGYSIEASPINYRF